MAKHYLFRSHTKCCVKSKESMLLITSCKKTLHSTIGREILDGSIDYEGKSRAHGFEQFLKDCLAGEDVLDKLQNSRG